MNILFNWKKHGIIFTPNGFKPWAYSHASIPTPLRLSKDIIRIFYTTRDRLGISRPAYVDVKADNPCEVLSFSQEPLLNIGEPGTFDENGILLCSVVEVGKQLYMYYSGFELGTQIRYRIMTGLAISDNNGQSFTRISRTPILERSDSELFFRGGAHVIYTPKGFKMWYVGGDRWLTLNNKQQPVYDIKYLESDDGINWPKNGYSVLKADKEDEFGFGRPYIHKIGKQYYLHYSIRCKKTTNYRLGLATSSDRLNWKRIDDKLNLHHSKKSFDSEQIMYATPILLNNSLYLFYNGNDFGRDGIALASCELSNETN